MSMLLRRRGIVAQGAGEAPTPPDADIEPFESPATNVVPRVKPGGGNTFAHWNTGGSFDRRRCYRWDDPGTGLENFEVLARIANAGRSFRQGVVVRATSGTNGYVAQIRPGGDYQLAKYVSGTFTALDTVAAPQNAGAWRWVRLRVVGDNIKAKFWLDKDDEPVSWTFDETDSDLAGPGGVGLFGFDRLLLGMPSDPEEGPLLYCSYIAIDEDGGTAPGPDDTPGTGQTTEDFDSYTPSTTDTPSGWTSIWETGNQASRVVDDSMTPLLPPAGWRPLAETSGATPAWDNTDDWVEFSNVSGVVALVWDGLGKRGDVEVYAEVRSSSVTSDNFIAAALGVAGDDSGDIDGYIASFSSNFWGIRRLDDSAVTSLTSESVDSSTGTWYSVRFRREGTTLKAKRWLTGDAEPMTGGPDDDGFTLKTTDATHGAGWVGFLTIGSFGNKRVRQVEVVAL